MRALQRLWRPIALSCVFVFGLFWLLHALISGGHGDLKKGEALPTIDFVRLNKAFEVETRERKPPEMPEKPDSPPQSPTPEVLAAAAPSVSDVSIGDMALENTTAVRAGFGLSSSDGEYLPIVKVAPLYPPRAQQAGQEGWVLLEFTVTETGTVVNPVVIESEPTGVFDEAAKKAVVKFKYKPRVEGGRAIAVSGVQHLITFKITK